VTAAELLSELRQLGVQVKAEAGQLHTRPAGAVPAGLRPLLVQYRSALLELVEMTCPGCGDVDYLSLADGWRRCWTCGTRWGAGRDPGDPSEVKGLAALLGLQLPEPASTQANAGRPGSAIGSGLRCPRCGNRAYSTPPIGVPHRRCNGPNGCGHTWNPEVS
jgi:hypothetical protein